MKFYYAGQRAQTCVVVIKDALRHLDQLEGQLRALTGAVNELRREFTQAGALMEEQAEVIWHAQEILSTRSVDEPIS